MPLPSQLTQTDFFENTGGTNLSDSVFKVDPGQAAGGYNFDYTLTGGIRKRLGPSLINSAADTQLRSLGVGLHYTAGGVKSVVRAAGTALQYVNVDTPSFTALAADTAVASTTPLTAGSVQSVQFAQFNNGTANLLWTFGGGQTLPNGVLSTSQYTLNGVAVPTGAITATRAATSGTNGTFAATGLYYYAVVYRKRSTQATSNAVLDVSATVSVVTDHVTIGLTGLTGLDQTLVDQIWIYRTDTPLSAAASFTTGSLIAQLASSTTSFIDYGSSVLSAQNVPRVNSTILDSSVLPAGTYNVGTVFKRRMVTAQNSTLYLSDLNLSEAWPTTNIITIPSAGQITALAVISFTSPQAQSLDEILVIYKEREMWVITGDAYVGNSTTGQVGWVLKFIDQVGCPEQGLVVLANGFLSWIDFRGIYLWDGTSKPIYCSRLVEPLFARDGDIDKTLLNLGTAEFIRRENQIIWYLSSKTYGEQKLAVKMDLRLTLPMIQQNMTGRNIDAVLIQDVYAFPIYAGMSYIPSGGADEQLLIGDASGYLYHASAGYADSSANYAFTYLTRFLDMGDPNTQKFFHRVIVWVQDLGTWNLELDYWSNYRTGSVFQSTRVLPISTENQTAAAYWDMAYWDTAYWDTTSAGVVPLVFNLDAGAANSAQGTSLQLQFKNSTANQPIMIHGFSVVWSALGGVT